MKQLFFCVLISLVLNLNAQQPLVQPKLIEAVEIYTVNHDYKINQQGFLIVEVESFKGDFTPRSELDISKTAQNYELQEFKIVIHPEYDSRYLSVNPALNYFLYDDHLIYLYNGVERLISKPLSKDFFRKNKRFFMDLNKTGYYSGLVYHTKIDFNGSDFIVQDSILRYESKFIFPE